jgi:Ca-activated chloride channel family protein
VIDYTFAYPWVLLGLLSIPLLAAIRFVPSLQRRRRGTFILSTAPTFRDLPRGFRQYLRPVADVLYLLALALLIVALARPQTVRGDPVDVEGIDIYLALDMSASMQAVDVSDSELRRMKARNQQPPIRFEEAVSTLKEFVESRKHDRIGMTVFAKEAFLQFPLTLDYRTILEMLDRLELGDIDPDGTVIGNALGRAVAGLEQSDADTKIVVLITDGDRRGGNVSPKKAAELAAQHDIRIFPILVGSDGPARVPRQRPLGGIKYVRRDFPTDPELLRSLADETGGTFHRASDGEKLRGRLHDILDRFERTQLEDSADVDRDEEFPPFVLGALLLIGLQFFARYTWLRAFP